MPLPLPPERHTGDGDPAGDVNLLSAAIAELQPLLGGGGGGGGDVYLDADQTFSGANTFEDDVSFGSDVDITGGTVELSNDAVISFVTSEGPAQLELGVFQALFEGDAATEFIVDGDPYRVRFRTHYWNGSSSANADGMLTLEASGGSPYFEFDKSVRVANDVGIVGGVNVFQDSQEDYTAGYASLYAAYLDLGPAQATSGDVDKRSRIEMAARYWDGDEGVTVAAGILQYLPDAGTPYFEFNQQVVALGQLYAVDGLNVGAYSGNADGAIGMYGGHASFIGREATDTPHPHNTAYLIFRSTYWNGSESVDSGWGTLSLPANNGSPYFEFDLTVRAQSFEVNAGNGATGSLEAGSLSLVPEDANEFSDHFAALNLYASHWTGTESTALLGQLGLRSGDGSGPYFHFNLPTLVTTTGAVGSSRHVGGTATGAPVAGDFLAGDFITTADGHMWVCSVSGSPGTWRDLG